MIEMNASQVLKEYAEGRRDFSRLDLHGLDLRQAILRGVDLRGTNLQDTVLVETDLYHSWLDNADLERAKLLGVNLSDSRLNGTNLQQTDFRSAYLVGAEINKSDLRRADIRGANLLNVKLIGTDLRNADLSHSNMIATVLYQADLRGCRVYGVSAWDVFTDETTKQVGIIITQAGYPIITVDSLEIAQFIYLLLSRPKIRDVIDTVAKKAVLILGRFQEGRIVVLERFADHLRAIDYVPIIFDFDAPVSQDFIETIQTLAHLSRFIIADVTEPRSVGPELQSIFTDVKKPTICVLQNEHTELAVLRSMQRGRKWAYEGTIKYESIDHIEALFPRIIEILKQLEEVMKG